MPQPRLMMQLSQGEFDDTKPATVAHGAAMARGRLKQGDGERRNHLARVRVEGQAGAHGRNSAGWAMRRGALGGAQPVLRARKRASSSPVMPQMVASGRCQ